MRFGYNVLQIDIWRSSTCTFQMAAGSGPVAAELNKVSFDAGDFSSADDGAEGEWAAAAVLFVVSSGDFFGSSVNLGVVKSAVAETVGLGRGDGGADFCEVSLSHASNLDTTRGWVVRSTSAEGAAALSRWCEDGPRSDPLPAITFVEGGGGGSVEVTIDYALLGCGAGGEWSVAALHSAAADLPCASKKGLGVYRGCSLVLSLFLSDMQQLQLQAPGIGHGNDRKLLGVVVMAGTAEVPGLRRQAEDQGYSAALLPVSDVGSPHHRWKVRPKPVAGSRQDALTEGCLMQVNLTPPVGSDSLKPFLLRGALPWPEFESIAITAGGGASCDVRRNPLTTAESWTDGYTSTRLVGSDGAAYWAFHPVGTDPVPLWGDKVLQRYVEPKAPRRRVGPERVKKSALAAAGAAQAARPFYAVQCKYVSLGGGPQRDADANRR